MNVVLKKSYTKDFVRRGMLVDKRFFSIFQNDKKIGHVEMLGLEEIKVYLHDLSLSHFEAGSIRESIIKNAESIYYLVRQRTIKC